MPREIDYNSAEFESADLAERFPNWALGLGLWREFCRRLDGCTLDRLSTWKARAVSREMGRWAVIK